jgi:hypothetical protein
VQYKGYENGMIIRLPKRLFGTIGLDKIFMEIQGRENCSVVGEVYIPVIRALKSFVMSIIALWG